LQSQSAKKDLEKTLYRLLTNYKNILNLTVIIILLLIIIIIQCYLYVCKF
jgi:hypothetical protein